MPENILRIKKIITETLGIPEEEITEDGSFTQDFAIDSLDLLELITQIEKEFDIVIPDEEVEKLTTSGLLNKYVSEYRKNKPGRY